MEAGPEAPNPHNQLLTWLDRKASSIALANDNRVQAEEHGINLVIHDLVTPGEVTDYERGLPVWTDRYRMSVQCAFTGDESTIDTAASEITFFQVTDKAANDTTQVQRLDQLGEPRYRIRVPTVDFGDASLPSAETEAFMNGSWNSVDINSSQLDNDGAMLIALCREALADSPERFKNTYMKMNPLPKPEQRMIEGTEPD